MKNFLALVVFSFFIGVFSFQTSFAQEETPTEQAQTGTPLNEVEDAWFLRCNKPEDRELENKRGACEIFQRIDVRDTGQRLVEMAIGFPDDKEAARGIFILPTGILLKPGVTMQIDDNQPMKFDVRYCVPDGCIAYVTLNDAVLDLLRKGEEIKVEVKQVNGETITLPILLKGITKALEQIS